MQEKQIKKLGVRLLMHLGLLADGIGLALVAD